MEEKNKTYKDMFELYVKNIIAQTYFYIKKENPNEKIVKEIFNHLKNNGQL